MFTVTWTQPAEYGKDVHKFEGYFYTDTTCRQYAVPVSQAVSSSGNGDTLALACKALRKNIEARLSKNLDKPIVEALKNFDAAIK